MQTLFLSYRFRKELEEGRSSGAQPQVAQFVHHHKVISVVGFEHPGEAVLVLGQEEFLGQGQGGGETDRIACGDAGCGNTDGHMGLAGARVSQKDKVLLAAKEVSLGQGENLLFRQRWKAQEVVLLKGASIGKLRSFQEVLQPLLLAGGPFRLQAFPKVVPRVGGNGTVPVVPQNSGKFEIPTEDLDRHVPVVGKRAHATASLVKASYLPGFGAQQEENSARGSGTEAAGRTEVVRFHNS